MEPVRTNQTPIYFLKERAFEEGARDPLKVASFLRFCSCESDLQRSLKEIRRNEWHNGRNTIVSMHVDILKHHGLWFPGYEVDHRDNCETDNRKRNWRLSSRSENGSNKSRQRNNTSRHTGVYWNKQCKKWRAKITVGQKDIHLGYFDDKQDAIEARAIAESKFFGAFRFDPLDTCPLTLSGECPDCARRLAALPHSDLCIDCQKANEKK